MSLTWKSRTGRVFERDVVVVCTRQRPRVQCPAVKRPWLSRDANSQSYIAR